MEDYEVLLKDPKFKSFIEKKGFQLKERKEYKGLVTLADNVERAMRWDFTAESFLRTIMHANNVEKLDPMNNMIHFSMVLYAMVVADMISEGEPNDKFVPFEDFMNLLPTNASDILSLIEVMNSVFAKTEKFFSVK